MDSDLPPPRSCPIYYTALRKLSCPAWGVSDLSPPLPTHHKLGLHLQGKDGQEKPYPADKESGETHIPVP